MRTTKIKFIFADKWKKEKINMLLNVHLELTAFKKAAALNGKLKLPYSESYVFFILIHNDHCHIVQILQEVDGYQPDLETSSV